MKIKLKRFNSFKNLPWLAVASFASFAIAAPTPETTPDAEEQAAPAAPTSNATSSGGGAGIWSQPAHEGYTPDYQGSAQTVADRISRVTVYSDRAQITRAGSVELKGGFQWLVFAKLPASLDKSSLRLTTPHLDGKIAQVLIEDSFEHVALDGELKGRVRRLRELHGELLELTQAQGTAEQHHAFVRSLSYEAPFSKSKGGKDYKPFAASSSAIQASMEEIRQRAEEDSAHLQTLAKKRQKLEEEIATEQAKIQSATSTSEQKWAVNVYVLVHSAKTRGSLDLSYMIPNALWRPVYDVRADLDRNAGRASIELVTAASVEQHTGENWKDTELSVSTLDPVPLYLPRLTRWTLSETRQEAEAPQSKAKVAALSSLTAPAAPAPLPPAPAMRMQAMRKEAEMSALKKTIARRDMPTNAKDAKEAKAGAAAGASAAAFGMLQANQLETDDADVSERAVAPAESVAKMDQLSRAKPAASQRFTLQSLEELFPSYGALAQNLRAGEGATERRFFDPAIRPAAPQKNSYGDSMLPAVQAQGRLLEYTSPFHVDIANDEEPYKIPLRSQSLTADLTYFAVPKKDARVYLKAETTNTTRDPLLAGALQIFMNGDLVAKGNLQTIAEGGHFSVDLGVDSNVETKRTVSMNSRDSGLIVTEHVTEVEIKIELANHHTFPVKMEIRDNYPLSPINKVKAELLTSSPDPFEKDNGLISWKVTVPASSKKTLKFNYRVTYPSDYILSEFN